MTRTLYLHIGIHKTGTTSIQSTLAGFDDGTTAYFKISNQNAGWDMFTMFSDRRAEHWLNRKYSAADLAERTTRITATAEAMFAGNRKNYIISGELMSQMFKAQEIGAMLAFMRRHFDDIRLIVYVRDPVGYMRSVMQQFVKNGPLKFDLDLAYPDYRNRLEPWFDAFPPDRREIVLFDPKRFEKGDVVFDFARRVGITVRDEDVRRVNESLTAEAYAMRFALRTRFDDKGTGLWGKARVLEELRFVNQFGSRKLDLAAGPRDAVIARRADDVAWMEAQLGEAFPPVAPYKDAITFGSTEDVLDYARKQRAAFDAFLKPKMRKRRVLRAIGRVLIGRKPHGK
ncbi:MAG: hypothetical protein RLZZ528_2582 [Pseudomonadota bacterium]